MQPLWQIKGTSGNNGRGGPVTLKIRAANHGDALKAATAKHKMIIDSCALYSTDSEKEEARKLCAAHIQTTDKNPAQEEERADLFDNLGALPAEAQRLIQEFGEEGETYENCNKLLEALKPYGLTFDYDLSAYPYDLRQIENEEPKS